MALIFTLTPAKNCIINDWFFKLLTIASIVLHLTVLLSDS